MRKRRRGRKSFRSFRGRKRVRRRRVTKGRRRVRARMPIGYRM